MFVDSIDSIDLSNREFLFSIGRMQLSIGLLHPISERTCLFELLYSFQGYTALFGGALGVKLERM